MPGLMKIMEKMAVSDLITTIIPGRLYKSNSNNIQNGLELRLTTSVEKTLTTEKKGYPNTASLGGVTQKIVARKASLVQEVRSWLCSCIVS